MIETIKEEEDAKLEEMTAAFEGNREETRNKNMEDLDQMKHGLIKKIEELDTAFESSFNAYVGETEKDAQHQRANEDVSGIKRLHAQYPTKQPKKWDLSEFTDFLTSAKYRSNAGGGYIYLKSHHFGMV